MPPALLALAIGAFGIGTTEFAVTGLLPEIQREFDVSAPTAGYLASGYALGVVAGAPLMVVLGARAPRKRMLLVLMVLFTLGNALSAAAPSFGLLLAGRVVASLAHGGFFGIGSVVAAGLVAPHRRAQAIALMFTGLTVANVVGVPLATLLAQRASWRLSFAAVAAVGLLALAGVGALVPREAGAAQGAARGPGLRRELATLRNPQVLLAMAMTVLGFGGVFAAITYISEMMTEAAGYAESSVTWLLVLFGVGLVAGNLVGGRYADRALMPMLYTALTALALALAAFTWTAHHKVPAAVTLTLIGAFGFATTPPLQKRILDQGAEAPTLASALNIGAFNLGNALAAWLGGLVLASGAEVSRANLVGAGMAATALVTALLSTALERRAAAEGRGGTRPGRRPAPRPERDAAAPAATPAANRPTPAGSSALREPAPTECAAP
ncbi:MFS transporter [Streptomyces hoynatensis]|uniref:MFS transporter n=1 Tax=Streptomyces hoynatensis TaxID=1141874 RepID=A0A3A9YCH7_9ACTN|nr:MFS transporter [Streptomyces hoynatensis]RKN34965.1 MFS transporter [Streptomyces hoynatensis]